nr:hypothetical protein [Tanacetum cinerariifolium]
HNRGEPSKDRNGRDDNKRTRTGNVFATTANHVRKEYMVRDSINTIVHLATLKPTWPPRPPISPLPWSLERPLVLPPPLPAHPPVPPPRDAAASRLALWVVILSGII